MKTVPRPSDNVFRGVALLAAMQRRAFLAATAGIAGAGCITRTPLGGDERVDASGDIEIRIDGEPLDLSADRFQSEHADESPAFHLHAGDDDWYMEGEERVTVAEGLDLLPQFEYANEEGFHVLTIDDTTYDQREAGTDLAFLVNGDSVDPTTRELTDGDAIRVEITTDA